MNLSQTTIEKYLEDDQHNFMFFDKAIAEELHRNDYPYEFFSIFLTLKGSVTIESHGQCVTAKENYLQVYMHDPSLRIDKVSEDYDCIGMVFSKKFWRDELMLINPYVSLALLQPGIQLSEGEVTTIQEFYHSMKALQQIHVPEGSTVFRSVFYGLFQTIGRYYKRWVEDFCGTSDSLIFVKFIRLLIENNKVHREVSFYADEIGISSANLSSRIKKTIGISALKCIEKYTLLQLCSELRTSTKSVKELAIEYNFSDSSHLCKFFRATIGESPEQYRQHCYFVGF